MTFMTKSGTPVDADAVINYIESLINRFFKILPIKENNEETLGVYIESLQLEMLGCKNLIPVLSKNGDYFSLLSILQYLIDNPDTPTRVVKREVFKAISICTKLKSRLTENEDGE